MVAHLYAAAVHRWTQRHAEAERELARARALADGHPFAYLVPNDTRWQCALPTTDILEIWPGRVYRVIGESRATHADPFGVRNVATFFGVRSGALVCINSVQLDDATVAKLRALGEVTHIVAPAKYHNEHLVVAKSYFPEAKIIGVPGQRGYPQVRHVPFDGFLNDEVPLFPDEIDQVTTKGADVEDVFFLD